MATVRGASRSLEDTLNDMAREIRALKSTRSVIVGRYTLSTTDSGVLIATDTVTGRTFEIVNPEVEE